MAIYGEVRWNSRKAYPSLAGDSYSTSTNLLHTDLQNSLELANTTFDSQVQTANLTRRVKKVSRPEGSLAIWC